MLQIIIFAIIVGITITKLNKDTKHSLKKVFNLFNDLFLKMIDLIMLFAPYGVFLILKALCLKDFLQYLS